MLLYWCDIFSRINPGQKLCGHENILPSLQGYFRHGVVRKTATRYAETLRKDKAKWVDGRGISRVYWPSVREAARILEHKEEDKRRIKIIHERERTLDPGVLWKGVQVSGAQVGRNKNIKECVLNYGLLQFGGEGGVLGSLHRVVSVHWAHSLVGYDKNSNKTQGNTNRWSNFELCKIELRQKQILYKVLRWYRHSERSQEIHRAGFLWVREEDSFHKNKVEVQKIADWKNRELPCHQIKQAWSKESLRTI